LEKIRGFIQIKTTKAVILARVSAKERKEIKRPVNGLFIFRSRQEQFVAG
jgi:predicted site-specific integrase-resolvase